MEKISYFLFLLFYVVSSCNFEKNHEKKISYQKESYDSIKAEKFIENLYSGTDESTWSDEGSFWLLYFKKNQIVFEFNPSCSATFPTKISHKKIVFYWEKNFNCNFNRDLSTSFQGIKNPEIHKEFGELYYIDDSTLTVNYYYKDWINAINNLEKSTIDTLFPSTFKRIIL